LRLVKPNLSLSEIMRYRQNWQMVDSGGEKIKS
jgi:hypothetical protein